MDADLCIIKYFMEMNPEEELQNLIKKGKFYDDLLNHEFPSGRICSINLNNAATFLSKKFPKLENTEGIKIPYNFEVLPE